jgi:UDP-glucose 4-epimerase
MNILIIGSKGFIGNLAYHFFKQQGFNVNGVDVLNDNTDEDYNKLDSSNPNFDAIFSQKSFDVCINCSGAASVSLSLENPLNDFNLNTLNVFKILNSIKLYNPSCKFINISSAAVYGNPDSLPINENSVLKPLSPYGIHKLQAEQICKEFNEFFGLNTCSIRIFSAYGNGLKKQIFWDLYNKFSVNSTVELFGTGYETRDFIHVEDVINAIFLVVKNSSFNADVINIANGEEYSIKTITDLFKKCLNSKNNIQFNNIVKPGDPLNWKADISKLKAMGYKPTVTLEEGILSYVSWVKGLDNH